MATVTLRLPPSAAHVRTARLVAAAMARRSGVGEECLDEVRLAVCEACARAVRRHNRYEVTEPVTVEFVDQERFRVTVLDAAPSANREPAEAGNGLGSRTGDLPGADLEPWTDPTAEALGLALLGAVVHDLTVEERPEQDGTRLTMSWPLER